MELLQINYPFRSAYHKALRCCLEIMYVEADHNGDMYFRCRYETAEGTKYISATRKDMKHFHEDVRAEGYKGVENDE